MTMHSWCYVCARIFYDREYEKCPRCGGLCHQFTTDDLALMTRRAVDEHTALAGKT